MRTMRSSVPARRRRSERLGYVRTAELQDCRIFRCRAERQAALPYQFHYERIAGVRLLENHNDAAIIPDLGMLASADPVALDKACADLVIQAPVLHSDNVLAKKHEHEDLCGCDKFHMIHPDTDWLAGLRHAEKIGLGTMDYELIKI